MSAPWRILLTVPVAQVEIVEQALAVFAEALSITDAEPGPGAGRAGAEADWRGDLWIARICIVEAIATGEPDRAAVSAALAVAAAAAGTVLPQPCIEPVPLVDWVAETQRRFPPVEAGRFHVHGHAVPPRPGRRNIRIDAGTAFGTGEHASTRGCLLTLDRIARRRRVRRAIDMGCGTGILAIGIVRAWPARVLAVDIDPWAVRVARENLRANGVGNRVQAVTGARYGLREVRRFGAVDLVTANILARPLRRLAPGLARRLRPGGAAVLSGLLDWQAPGVIAAHRLQGLVLVSRVRLNGWTTLRLERSARRA